MYLKITEMIKCSIAFLFIFYFCFIYGFILMYPFLLVFVCRCFLDFFVLFCLALAQSQNFQSDKKKKKKSSIIYPVGQRDGFANEIFQWSRAEFIDVVKLPMARTSQQRLRGLPLDHF